MSLTVAGGVLAAATFELSTPHPSSLTTTFGFISALVLLARTRTPVTTLVVLAPCGVLPTLIAGTYPDFYGAFVPALAGVYAVAVHSSARRVVFVPLFGGVVVLSFAVRVPSFVTAGQLVYTVSGLALAFLAGRTMRLLRARADIERARADLMAREREVQAREAVLAERERIARDLHDVIAHDVAVMVVQAGAAERIMPDRPAQAAQSLVQIQASGRKAIDELHLLLGMLRDDQHAVVARPGLHALTTLVDELTRLGLPISLQVTGAVRDVGDALDVSAYRLVQEALTNVLKHAAGSRTHVAIRYGTSTLTVEVLDDGDGVVAHPTELPSSGHGLIGMRERVTLFGGTLTVGSRADGGWAITAELPIPVVAA